MPPCEFSFDLPQEQIAQAPLNQRATSRLLDLALDGRCEDRQFTDLSRLVAPGDRLVLNDTQVLPARVFGKKASGGKIELLLERILTPQRALFQLRSSKAPKAGQDLLLDGGVRATVDGRDGPFYLLVFRESIAAYLENQGHMPLPPYIRRRDDALDRDRYQTVYARVPGAVAAPTAGLHFDAAQIKHLRSRGVGISYLTLHVGAGTFSPLRDEQIATGKLHRERAIVSDDLCAEIAETRELGGRVVAVGTTAVRALETAAQGGELQPFDAETQLFIRPGFHFRIVDALLTNFHLPASSLLMLVCAFSGADAVMAAYRHAVASGYRFYSYGDAMFCRRAHAV